MATGKRFYWFKLKKDFMEGDEVDYIMSLEDGSQYIVLYIMLCIMCVNTEGMLLCRIGDEVIPANMQKIKRACRFFNEETIRNGLSVFLKLGLLYKTENEILAITGFDSLVGAETDYAVQKKKQRERKKSIAEGSISHNTVHKKTLASKGHNLDKPVALDMDSGVDSHVDIVHTKNYITYGQRVDNVHTEKEIDKDKEIDTDKYIDNSFIGHKKKDKNSFQNTSYSSNYSYSEQKKFFASGPSEGLNEQETVKPEIENSSVPVKDKTPVAILPLADGSFYRVSSEEAEYYQSLFPMHDVAVVLKSMSRWLSVHPEAIASAEDTSRFVIGWFTSGPPVLTNANIRSASPARSSRLSTGSEGHSGNNCAAPESSGQEGNASDAIEPKQDGSAAVDGDTDSIHIRTAPGVEKEISDGPDVYRQEELFPTRQKSAYSNKVFSYPLNDGTYFQISAENKEYFAAFYDGRDLDREFERIGEYFNRFSMHLKSPEEISGFIESWIMDGPAPEPDPVYGLVLNDGIIFPVYEEDIAYYQSLYPAVDIDAEFRKMIGWIDGNPNKRKTKRGIKRFINSWLSKAQDRSGSGNGNGYTGRTSQMLEGSYQMYADWAREMEEKEKGADNDIL